MADKLPLPAYRLMLSGYVIAVETETRYGDQLETRTATPHPFAVVKLYGGRDSETSLYCFSESLIEDLKKLPNKVATFVCKINPSKEGQRYSIERFRLEDTVYKPKRLQQADAETIIEGLLHWYQCESGQQRYERIRGVFSAIRAEGALHWLDERHKLFSSLTPVSLQEIARRPNSTFSAKQNGKTK